MKKSVTDIIPVQVFRLFFDRTVDRRIRGKICLLQIQVKITGNAYLHFEAYGKGRNRNNPKNLFSGIFKIEIEIRVPRPVYIADLTGPASIVLDGMVLCSEYCNGH